ncbi:MAG: hypothetical protein QM757_30635 [Paludibaculum sp.]
MQSPQIHVNIDRDSRVALQINAQQIENALYNAYGPRWVSTIYTPANEYTVILEVDAKVSEPTRSRWKCCYVQTSSRTNSSRSTRVVKRHRRPSVPRP